jgi:hypothetical protein
LSRSKRDLATATASATVSPRCAVWGWFAHPCAVIKGAFNSLSSYDDLKKTKAFFEGKGGSMLGRDLGVC